MKKKLMLLALLLCTTPVLSAETNSVAIKLGNMIGNHTQDMKAYPKIEQPRDKPFGEMPTEVVMWKVGDGIFSVTHSIGVGIITAMNYTIPSERNEKIVFKVKEFNPKTGELTILVPNKPTGGDVQ